MTEFKSFYKTVLGNEGSKCRYPTRLDPYGCGCSHDCSYCYAKALLSFRHKWSPEDPGIADLEKIRKRCAKIPKGTIVRLGGMTDCFQPIERKYKNTYETIKALNENGIGYLIVTKSAMIAEDQYMEVLDKDLAHIQVSVTTTEDERARWYEKASPPSERIRAIRKLQDRGFDVMLRLSPLIPEYVDFDALNRIRCDKLLVEFLRVNYWIKKWFDIDYTAYTLRHGGYLHLPLEVKRQYLGRITGFREVSVCDDVDEHYDYWKHHWNPNPEDCCNLRLKGKRNGTEEGKNSEAEAVSE